MNIIRTGETVICIVVVARNGNRSFDFIDLQGKREMEKVAIKGNKGSFYVYIIKLLKTVLNSNVYICFYCVIDGAYYRG